MPIKTINMNARCKGIDGSVVRYEHDFSGVMTELRYDMMTNEWTLIITDEIAQSFGYQDIDQLFESDFFLDALIKQKMNRTDTPHLKIKGVKYITN